MNNPQHDNAVPESDSPDGQDNARTAARRRFIGGAAAAPILLSLTSRPVMGAARHCAPSGFMSGNTSPQPGQNMACGGLSPGYWKNHTNWPAPYTPATLFHAVFAGKAKYNYGNDSLMTVLQNNPGSFAFHTIACLLNAASHIPDYALTTAMVIKIWNDISTTGYFLTSNGKKMYEADAKAFFEQTYSA